MIKELKTKKKNILFAVLIVVAAIGITVLAISARQGGSEPAAEAGNPYHDTLEGRVPLLVDFEPLETTAEEYDLLYNACHEYMIEQKPLLTNYASKGNGVISVTEDTFIDSEGEISESESPVSDEYVEYDRFYFDDFLMIRYVSKTGAIQVIGAQLMRDEKSGTQVNLVDQMDFNASHFTKEETQEEGWSFWPVRKDEVEGNPGAVSEDAFVICVGECISGMLTGNVDYDTFYSHFTAEGEAALLRIAQVLGIDSDCYIGVLFGASGISSLENSTVDRVYLRCELVCGSDVRFLNILVKLNSDLMVFDVDII